MDPSTPNGSHSTSPTSRTSHSRESITTPQPDPLNLGKTKQNSSNFGFLCQNVRFLNQPICSLVGEQNKVNHRQQFVAQNVSLASHVVSEEIPQAKYSDDSTQRRDFPNFSEKLLRPNRIPQQPAQGIVPGVGPESGRKVREKISYEHIYDCRTDLNYPPRGKRLGTFV